MKTYTIRDSADGRLFLAQGLWWQRVLPPRAPTVRPVLEWAKELATSGQPLPPIGFVADLGHVAFGEDWEARAGRDVVTLPNLPIPLVRTYEDHVLGKIYADWTFGRACDALKRYEKGRKRARALAFLLTQFHERARYPGVEMSPGIITTALESPPEELLLEGSDSIRQGNLHPLLAELYEGLIQASRRTAEVLGQDDLFELENGTALDEPAQRLARQQVLRAALGLEATLPRTKVRPLARRMEVPTRILDEDTYPVGGFTSVSNRGSVESLLHSQLAYMEPPGSKAEGPDLFDCLFLMDELLYYSRDENQFLRRRRTFVFALGPDLVDARFKDAELPYQRIVLLLALVFVVFRKLTEWLSTDALVFRFLFLGEGEVEPLADERKLLEVLLREPIALQTAVVDRVSAKKLAGLCEGWARKSMVHCLMLGAKPANLEAKETVVNRLAVRKARPALGDRGEAPEEVEGDDAMESWAHALQQILQRWI
jgi:hypothetical protein